VKPIRYSIFVVSYAQKVLQDLNPGLFDHRAS